ncbi:MAG: DNA gyrase/topoisomerase IV subunit A [Muribaculaceae bacterium]|nr:DNA gyrase/topoisomerase IV subunit A [Muribaculaceae bacterium]
MSDDFNEIIDYDDNAEQSAVENTTAHSSGSYSPLDKKSQLSGMYRSWFLDYASYVILERAVPHIEDGLKPVQRRILHSMKEEDDGTFIKVANIVGNTMKYHPHGDASIGDALVQLGQKNILIETQGNWGNILTGDGAAAPRYIEARLSELALEILYNEKTTEWTPSYDGRNREPVTLPVKFPLLLAQGVEGIAVGLSSKILPHNFNELIDAAICHLRDEEFTLYPDFQTGGYVDVSRYNDGERGGVLKVRAKIEKIDNKTLLVTDLPYGKTTGTLIESILKAGEKGKIKIRKVEDNTSDRARIKVHLIPGTSSDRTIDALYAFSDCEVSISPNCCVIKDQKPHFLKVSDVLRYSVESTKKLLQREQEILRAEALESLFFASLERIFIEERIYKDKEYEQSKTIDDAVVHIDSRLTPFKDSFIRDITKDDILRLMEIKMKRIIRFNSDKADNYIASLNERIEKCNYNIEHITDFTIDWFTHLKEKYGALYPRNTVIRGFDTIEASKVAEANEKLYINRDEGFIGTALKKDEFLCNCSDIDDVIIFYKNGKYKVVKVCEKLYIGKNVLHVAVFKRNDNRTIYNVVYQNGKDGITYMKRFAVTGITRDKEYDFTQGLPGTKVWWFSANPNGEAEVLQVKLKPKFRLKTLQFDVDLASLAIKGRSSLGNMVTKNEVQKISLKERGASTLGGRNVWFDWDVNRLNYDGRGDLLGEFNGTDSVLVILQSGEFYTTSFDASNHYDENIKWIGKFDSNKVWTAIFYDADQKYDYIKRFQFELSAKKQNFIGGNPKSQLIMISSATYPRYEIEFGGNDAFRSPLEIDAETFIGVKSFKAKGKRVANYNVAKVTELEPRPEPEQSEENDVVEFEGDSIDETFLSDGQQGNIFSDDNLDE